MLARLIYNIYFKKSYFYALIGIDFVVVLLFAFVYSSLLPWLQGAAALKHNVVHEGVLFGGPVTELLNCLYFSVITQMTVGFGDIVPSTPLAKLAVSMQAIFGYFYLAVLVSVLVGQVFSNKRIQSILHFPRLN